MPIYEYRCSSCGHELEALQKFSETPLVVCPSCEKNALVKLVSAGGFQLKGSGWYATDFKGSGGKPAPAKDTGESKADAKADSKPDAKSDAKSEAKPDSKSDATPASKSEAKGDGTTGSKGGGSAPVTGSGAAPPST